MLGQQMRRLSKLLPAGDAYALVSVTVDPEKDTPEVLAGYAKGLGVDDARWSFLTGKKADIKTLVEKGFKLSARPGEKVPDEQRGPGHPAQQRTGPGGRPRPDQGLL